MHDSLTLRPLPTSSASWSAAALGLPSVVDGASAVAGASPPSAWQNQYSY